MADLIVHFGELDDGALIIDRHFKFDDARSSFAAPILVNELETR